MDLHPILLRLINKSKVKDSNIFDEVEFTYFLNKVNKLFFEYEKEKYVIERSLAISSKDMLEKQEALEEERELLNAVMSDAAIFVDKKWQITKMNNEAKHLLNLEEEPKFGVPLTSVFQFQNTNDSEGILLTIELENLIKQQNQPYRFTSVIKCQNGFTVSVDVLISNISKNPDFSGAIILMRDISERIKLEKYLREEKEIAEKSNLDKSIFISELSEKFRNPITTVIGMSELLIESLLSHEQENYVKSIRSGIDELATVINDVLNYSKSDEPKISMQSASFWDENGINNKKESKGVNVFVVCNERESRYKLETALSALKVNYDCVNTGREALTMLYKASKNNYHYDYLIVDSNLSDMAGESLVKLIKSSDAFSKIKIISLTPSIKNQSRFSLIDYYINKKRIKAQLENIIDPSMHNNEMLSEINHDLFKDVSVLIVDANKGSQKLLSEFMKKWNCHYVLVDNGLDAITEFRKNNYDIVLLDCGMLPINAYECAKEMRFIEHASRQRHVPIIALLSNSTRAAKEKCIESGMNDGICKPYTKKQIFNIINKWLMIIIPDGVNHKNKLNNKEVNKKIEELHILGEECGSDLLTDIIKQYIQEFPEKLREIKIAHKQADRKTLFEISHSLRTTSAILGLDSAEHDYKTLEFLSNTPNFTEMDEEMGLVISRLEKKYPKIDAELRSYLKPEK